MGILLNKELWTEMLYTLKRNKRRSVVTSLGVFAGMFFFTILTSLSTGLRNSAFGMLEGVSSDVIYIIPGRTTKPYQGYKANRPVQTTYRDYLNIKSQSRLLQEVGAFTNFGVKEAWSSVQIHANNKSLSSYAYGVTPNHFQIADEMVALYGRILTPQELESGAPLCIVGRELAKRFYDNIEEMVGTYVTINGVPFKVVGVTEPLVDNFSINGMGLEGIMLPFTLAVGNQFDKEISIYAVPKAGYSEEDVRREVFEILARRQQLDPTDTGAIIPMSMQLVTNIFQMIASGINVLVWIVGMGTLITGVISVSNILLVTVRERQREIGVRRAIGAKPRDIRKQFMSEAIFIIVVAGALGILLGLLGALAIGAITEHTVVGNYITRPYSSLGLLILSVVIMVVSGVLAGLLPVYKALQIKAIDAIRDE